ncbi:MAG: hypothetical protein BWK80_14750 [Desulfobacteraceae bacterium IS3]|nr:MAG: hypothetical protein BWK80_14750 [Desulfobacteraceae bacterium IS3]
MAFLVYKKQDGYLLAAGENYSLAGYNLIYKLWEKREKPINKGWHISSGDLIHEYTNGKETVNTLSLLIDFHPTATTRIGIIELLDIYAYTYSYSGKTGNADWTPMMLRLRDVYYDEKPISIQEKEEILKKLKEPTDDKDFVEFLYINGNDRGWNWGRNGMTNAAFIMGEARDYFRKFF